MELKMKKEKNDLQKLNEQLDELYQEKISLEILIEDANAILDMRLQRLKDIDYDIDLKEQYIEIIKKREGVA